MECTVYLEKPDNFIVQKEAAGCYLWCQKKLLLVKRHENKPQGGTWGVPAGKLEGAESPVECVIRELKEEVSIDVGNDLLDIGRLYVRLGDLSYIFHMFLKKCDCFPEIKLLFDENVEARWVTLEEALDMPLIKGGREQIVSFQHYVSSYGI